MVTYKINIISDAQIVLCNYLMESYSDTHK